MTDKPDAGEAARRRRRIIEDCAEKMETTITELQDALLSSSKRIEELEKALGQERAGALEDAAVAVDFLATRCAEKYKLIASPYLDGAHAYLCRAAEAIRALKEKPHG